MNDIKKQAGNGMTGMNRGENEITSLMNKQKNDTLFYSVISLVFKYEGGYVDNRNDRGGRTNMGVTQRFLETYKDVAGIKASNVESLTRDDAVRLYKAEWDIYGFSRLDNADIVTLVYDFSVNSGPKVAIKCLQRALNRQGANLFVDGCIGEKTSKAVSFVDEKRLKEELLRSRAEHCDSIVDRNPEQRVFIKGWFNRINDIGSKTGCDIIFKSRHFT